MISGWLEDSNDTKYVGFWCLKFLIPLPWLFAPLCFVCCGHDKFQNFLRSADLKAYRRRILPRRIWWCWKGVTVERPAWGTWPFIVSKQTCHSWPGCSQEGNGQQHTCKTIFVSDTLNWKKLNLTSNLMLSPFSISLDSCLSSDVWVLIKQDFGKETYRSIEVSEV